MNVFRMRPATIGLLGLFLVWCAVPSQTGDPLESVKNYTKSADQREWQSSDVQNSKKQATDLKRDADWPGRAIFANESGCWRYCVKSKVCNRKTESRDSIKRVNIIWNVVAESEIRLAEKTPSSWGVFSEQGKTMQWESSTISSENSNSFSHDDIKCELYIVLGCQSSDTTNSTISMSSDISPNSVEKQLAARNDTTGLNFDVFIVGERTGKLNITIFGKIERIVLEIPIAPRGNNSTDGNTTRPTFLLSRTSDAQGLLIDARNPPPGEWRLNLLGMQNSKYSYSITATESLRKEKNSNNKDKSNTENFSLNEVSQKNKYENLDTKPDETPLRPQRTVYPRIIGNNNYKRAIETNDRKDGQELENDSEMLEPLMFPAPLAKDLILGASETRFSGTDSPAAELRDTESFEKQYEADSDKNSRIVVNSEPHKLSKIVEEIQSRSKTSVDLHPNTELLAAPGTFHDVVFTVTNNQALGIRHIFQGSSKPFPYVGVIPMESWIRPGQTVTVAVRIQVPNIDQPEPDIVTLYVRGSDNFEIIEKSAYVYVQNSDGRITADSEKPNIDYSFNDNCAGKLHQDRCSLSRWSVDITINDPESGLKRVTSVPSGVVPRTEFISGTKSKVAFYYSSTCCHTTVDITAIDLKGNSYTRTIDVTAWDNLSRGEIAAIIVGAVLIVLLVILMIVMIIYCVRKRKSQDLSYSQRYGSRSPASAERTNY